MKSSILLFIFLAIGVRTYGQDSISNPIVNFRVEARGGYGISLQDKEKIDEESGFKGEFLNVSLRGEFAHRFSYAWQQRMNKSCFDAHFFDATDYLYLSYKPVEPLAFSAGKQIVAIGGFEYDRAPIDLYFCSEYWHNIPCYQWGVSATYNFKNNKDILLAQICQSPFDTKKTDLYAFNLLWLGHHGIWNTIWSINAIGCDKGRYISYVSLGNKFKISRCWDLQIDVMNRAGKHQQWIFGDYSLIGELNSFPNQHLRIFAKASHDCNHSNTAIDKSIHAGTEVTRVGAGLEYYPLKAKWHDMVRLHVNYSYNWGTNTNPNGTLKDNRNELNVGLTCRVDAFKLFIKHKS